jgi:hypothetical protein
MNNIQHLHNIGDASTDTNEVSGNKSFIKYKKTIKYIENELYTTLVYLNNQLDIIDEQTDRGNSDNLNDVVPFNRNVYEAKKQIVEQKIGALRSLASIASEQVKLTKDNDDTITSITDLFQ